ncbi:Protein root UVB sensitive 5 [Abeliophyllum distichum]|uniref:Mitochondrial inner membrane protease subunit 2 n=1 Tax=Abeliophyllum distichum TaxID=126358 RepID=A0ABD1QY54_9LAMI
MYCALRLSFPSSRFDSRRKSTPPRFQRLQFFCKPLQSHSQEAEFEANSQHIEEEGKGHLILVEKYGNGTSRRYIVENDSVIRTILKEHLPETNVSQDSIAPESDDVLSWLPKIVKDFVLPAGFPESVSDDYLDYILLQFPTNVTGWICHTLVTSSLLKAVGVGSFSGTTAAASAAAISWVLKDGIGAIGRLFIGGRFGDLFDDDPRQWRLYADFVGSAGSIFDLTTQLYPAYFLPLASLGNLAKAVGRGLRDPSFRVIQNHFAISGNLGEVSAKEEVWEVAAELIGLSLGILALDTPGISSSYPVLGSTWLSMRLLHLWFRYKSLSVLRFNTINLKRARILVNSHILYSKVLGINDCNRMENILLWEKFRRPRIIFGVSLEEMISGKRRVTTVKMLLKLYAEEKYFLVVNQQQTEFEVFVSFKEGATSLSVLRSVWQTYWLNQNRSRPDDVFDELERSLIELKNGFDNFLQQLEETGWDTNQINLKLLKFLRVPELDTTDMATQNLLFDIAKKCFTVGLISLTVSDRYVSLTAIRGSSMSPTFNPLDKKSSAIPMDDYALVEKFCLEKYKFSHGDVVVFRSPSNHKQKNVKRITALPGDWVDVSSSFDTVMIPEGHCWVEGDNPACSMDSRSFGPIPLGLVCGRVTHVVWPPHRVGKVDRKITEHRLPF